MSSLLKSNTNFVPRQDGVGYWCSPTAWLSGVLVLYSRVLLACDVIANGDIGALLAASSSDDHDRRPQRLRLADE